MKAFSIFLSCLTFSISSFSTCFAYSGYTWSTIQLTEEVSTDLTVDNDDTSNSLNIDCGSCILIEQSTGEILYSYNMHEKLRPASVTKLMSIYLIMEAISKRSN